MTRAAVIGAGIAGLTAARRLCEAGVEVALFDKARRPGGRLSTRRAECYAFDHGAQYFTCRDPDFAEQVTRWCKRGVVEPWESRICTLVRGAIGDERGASARFVGVPGMSALGRDLAEDLGVECARWIVRVEGTAQARRLVDDAGRALEGFDHVLLATPAPQALPLLESAPALAERVAGVVMLPCLALLVGFEHSLGAEFGGAFVSESPLSWVARNDTKPGRPASECWVLHASPEWSEPRLEDPPDAALRPLLAAFAEALGRPLPPVAFARAHRWRFAQTSVPLGEWYLWDPDARLGVCGDWAIGGRVEGAYLSGERLARAVLAGLA